MNPSRPASSASADTAVCLDESWSRLRWFVGIAIAFAAHIGLIYIFGSRDPVVPRAVARPPSIQFTTRQSELLTLGDPTLFALPHPRGFAAASWLQPPGVGYSPFRWTEPPEMLTLSSLELENVFVSYPQSNGVSRIVLETLPPPRLTQTATTEETTALKQRSTVRIGSGLANRQWLNEPALLRSWPATELLTNSVIRVMVGEDGRVLSPALLPPGSGLKAADQTALEIARTARFAPENPQVGDTTGYLIFGWHTVAPTETNTPPTP